MRKEIIVLYVFLAGVQQIQATDARENAITQVDKAVETTNQINDKHQQLGLSLEELGKFKSDRVADLVRNNLNTLKEIKTQLPVIDSVNVNFGQQVDFIAIADVVKVLNDILEIFPFSSFTYVRDKMAGDLSKDLKSYHVQVQVSLAEKCGELGQTILTYIQGITTTSLAARLLHNANVFLEFNYLDEDTFHIAQMQAASNLVQATIKVAKRDDTLVTL